MRLSALPAPLGLATPLRPPRSRRPRALMGVTVAVLAVIAGVGVAAPANAASAIRTRLPLVSGSVITIGPNHETCTLGAVFELAGSRSAYNAAVRYGLTAGHCGHMNDDVYADGIPVGIVDWKSPASDMLLVKMNPTLTREQQCRRNAFGVERCLLVDVPQPRAASRAVLRSPRTHELTTIPVTRWTTPSFSERFCVSGQVTGVMCGLSRRVWSAADLGPQQLGEDAADSPSGLTAGGDSGAPIVSADGVLHGILCGVLVPKAGRQAATPGVLYYLNIYSFMQETHNAFTLAPS